MALFGPPDIDKLAEKGKVDGLIKALSYQDPGIRERAAEALGRIGDPRAVDALIAATADEDRKVANAAMFALGGFPDPRVIETLLALASDGKERAVWALEQMGAAGVEPLLAALAKRSDYGRAEIVRALGRIGDARAVAPLIAMLGESDAREARDALVKIGAPAVEPLVGLLRSRDSWRRSFVGDTLRQLGWKPAGPIDDAAFRIACGDDAAIEGIDAEAARELLGEVVDWGWCSDDWPVTLQLAHLLLQSSGPVDERCRDWAQRQLDAGVKRFAEELERIFEHPVDSSRLSRQQYGRMFGDYADLIIDAASYRTSTSGDDSGTRFFSYSVDSSRAAVERLCGIDTPVSSNILQLVSRLDDPDVTTRTVEVEYDKGHLSGESARSGVVSFASQRQRAREELSRRGTPAYDPSAYGEPGCWHLEVASA